MSGLGGALLGLLVGAAAGVLVGAAAAWAYLRTRSDAAGTEREPATHDRVPHLHELLLDGAPIAVLALDRSDDLVLVNRRARQLGLLDRRGPVEPLRELVRAGRQSGEVTREISLRSTRLRGSELHARVTVLPLPDRYVALLVEDVTEARRVDAVRRDFVANVSHEIKTPVGALRLLAEAALESMDDPEAADQTRHFLERMSRESARLGRLVSELLDLSRLQGAEARPIPTPVRLDDVVSEALDRVRSHAEAKNIGIARGPARGAVLPGVEPQLVTAVANLLDNAINYSPDGTRVAVAVRQRDDAWELTVSDQGLGIPEDDLDRIFERFYRVDPARSRATGGTGLGLAIVKHIVRNHGGEVRVWSSLDAGSTFTLLLPTVDPSTDENPETADVVPRDAAQSDLPTRTDGRRVTPAAPSTPAPPQPDAPTSSTPAGGGR